MKPKDKATLTVIVVALGSLGVLGLIGGLYWLAILAGEIGARVWAVVATLAIPAVSLATWQIATHAAREHLAGFDRGLTGAQRTVEAMGRSLNATASLARTARQTQRAQPAQPFDDLLPRPGSMNIVEAHSNSDQVVDL